MCCGFVKIASVMPMSMCAHLTNLARLRFAPLMLSKMYEPDSKLEMSIRIEGELEYPFTII